MKAQSASSKVTGPFATLFSKPPPHWRSRSWVWEQCVSPHQVGLGTWWQVSWLQHNPLSPPLAPSCQLSRAVSLSTVQSSPVAPSPPPSFCALMTQPPSQSWFCNLGSCSYPLRLLHAASFLSKASMFTKLLTQNSLFKSSGFFYAMRPNGLSCSNIVWSVS